MPPPPCCSGEGDLARAGALAEGQTSPFHAWLTRVIATLNPHTPGSQPSPCGLADFLGGPDSTQSELIGPSGKVRYMA